MSWRRRIKDKEYDDTGELVSLKDRVMYPDHYHKLLKPLSLRDRLRRLYRDFAYFSYQMGQALKLRDD